MRKCIILLAVILASCLNAVGSSHVTWSYTVNRISANTAEIQLTATIDEGCHFYAMQSDPEAEFGPLSLVFTFSPSKDYNLTGKTTEPSPIQEYEEMFGCTTFFFTKEVVFKQTINIENMNEDFVIKVNAYGQTCSGGSCSMVDDDIEIQIKKMD